MKLEIEIDDNIVAELEYLVELQQQHGAPNPCANVLELLAYVASVIADGSRRPGAWERQLLDMMGLVPDADEANQYRSGYGRPE